MVATGKRGKGKRARKSAPKRPPTKRSAAPKRKPTKPKPKRKPTKREREHKRRSAAAKKGWATRRARAAALARERESDYGDVEVVTGGYEPPEGYEPYPIPESPDEADFRAFQSYVKAREIERVTELGDRALEAYGEIEWFPRFDEVYDYIDALVEEFDLDAHELFEMAFGYADEATV